MELFSSRKLSVFFEINQHNRFDRFADVQKLYSGNTCWWVLRKIQFPTEIVLTDIKPLRTPSGIAAMRAYRAILPMRKCRR